MENASTAKPLALKNINNRFQCDAFLDLNFAPDPTKQQTEPWEGKIFIIQDGATSIFAQLVDYADMKFKNVSGIITIAATGLEWHEWRDEWMKRYPSTTNDTRMAVYCYKKVK